MSALMQQAMRIRNFRDYWRELGFSSAVSLARRNATGDDLLRLQVRGIRTPVFCRSKDSDFCVLRQVLGRKESDIKLNTTKPRLIVDCGANVGYATLLFANRYPDAKVIAVEPEPENCKMFRLNCKGYANVTLMEGAVWHKSGDLELTGPAKADSYRVQDSENRHGTVKAFTVMDLIDRGGEPQIDLLKIDIEGAELELLANNSDAWLGRVGVLVVELHDWFRAGCAQALDGAIQSLPHARERAGEYEVIRFHGSARVGPNTIPAMKDPIAP